MPHDIELVRKFYSGLNGRVDALRASARRPLTLTEKVLLNHLYDKSQNTLPQRGDYAEFRPDRVAMQDATAQMALLQFMTAGRKRSAVPSSIHCDHLICAKDGAQADLSATKKLNREVYEFLESSAACYGLDFWEPGEGIIHQIVLENYAFPGGMMVGTDSHTPNAGGLGMLAVGVGGSDAVDVMVGMPWELKVPKIIGVRLKGELRGWTSAKDVILELAGRLTTKGGTNAVIEYFGPGAATIPCTGKASICNMGAEVGATCSIFPFDEKMAQYLESTLRPEVAELAMANASALCADPEVLAAPEKYYDELIEIDLSTLEPHINGPFTPDACCTVGKMAARVGEMGYPDAVEVCLIGSCTNSSYQDLARAASVARSAIAAGLKPKAQLIVNPGSRMIKDTAERDGILDDLRRAGAVVMTNACGPCIGQWQRKTDDNTRPNTIVTTFNRNFAKRADGNPNTHAFIASPEMAVAYAFAGSLSFNPICDLIGGVRLDVPTGDALPAKGYVREPASSGKPGGADPVPEVIIAPGSERLQRLKPFEPWDGRDILGASLLIKTAGKCTTDHISMAGPWLRYRGHLENISENLLMGAVNAFNGRTNAVLCEGAEMTVSAAARRYRDCGQGSVTVAEDNYGEGSSREHAAMEPRFLGVKAVLAKSFARIHETNLKKQGVLALSFARPDDYDLVREGDRFDIHCAGMAPGLPLRVDLHHTDGTSDCIEAVHTYNEKQIEWFRAGSALNSLKP